MLNFLVSNFTNFTNLINGTGIIDYSLGAYQIALGFLFYPLFFSAIIGYVYVKQQSIVALAVIILIIMAAASNYMMHIPAFVSLLYIITALAVTALLLVFLTRWRQ